MAAPAGPAHNTLAAIIPSNATLATRPAGGAIAVVATHEQRWRIYVLPLRQSGMLSGYVAAMTPLGVADASVQAFGMLLLALARADAGVVLRRRPVDLDALVLEGFRSARQLAPASISREIGMQSIRLPE